MNPDPPRATSSPLPTISVALCTYQSSRYLREQIISILDQSVAVSEVVISDDGSTDDTLSIVTEIASSHPRGACLRVAATERVGGVGPNFERALAACVGDVIALSDHDDIWEPHRIAAALPRVMGHHRALVFSDALLIDENGASRGRTLFQAYDVWASERERVRAGDGFHVLQRRNIVTGATVMMTRDLVDVALPIPPRWVHDEWLAILASATGTLDVIDEPLVQYRVHGANQIGVPPRSALARARIALAVGRARFIHLRERDAVLLERLRELNAPATVISDCFDKAHFEDRRAHYSRIPPRRIPRIVFEARQGNYRRFSREWGREMWRDLLQRP